MKITSPKNVQATMMRRHTKSTTWVLIFLNEEQSNEFQNNSRIQVSDWLIRKTIIVRIIESIWRFFTQDALKRWEIWANKNVDKQNCGRWCTWHWRDFFSDFFWIWAKWRRQFSNWRNELEKGLISSFSVTAFPVWITVNPSVHRFLCPKWTKLYKSVSQHGKIQSLN